MSLAALIVSARTLAKDTSTSNFSRETPNGANDGSNKHFTLGYRNVIVANVFVTINTSYRSQSGYTFDDTASGISSAALLTFTAAPASGASPFLVDYNYYWFTDAEYTEFLNDSAMKLGQTDPTLVASNMVDILLQYCLGYFWQARATQYAHRYASSGGQVGQSVQDVTKAFKALADAAFKLADGMRDMFYKRQGQREAPATATVNYGIDPMTPVR